MTVFQNNQATSGSKFFPEIHEPAILVTPLDWGLGHATRCIPIIRCLLSLNQPVLLGGCGDSLKVLRLEFPDLPFVLLPEYNMRYPKENMLWNVALKLFLHGSIQLLCLTTHDLSQSLMKNLPRSITAYGAARNYLF
jgi:hypothetical protein